jgi:hypothetical protein
MGDRCNVSGIWVHWTNAKTEISIRTEGFNPKRIKKSFLGTALYTVRQGQRWMNLPNFIEFRVQLRPEEVMADFKSSSATGTTYTHVFWYLKEQGLDAYKTTRGGSEKYNLAIRDHFLGKKIKAIRFDENGSDVLAIYDTSCVQMNPKI